MLTLTPWFSFRLQEGRDSFSLNQLQSLGLCTSVSQPQRLTLCFLLPADRESQEHEDPTTAEGAEETYAPKVFRPSPKHSRISELKAEAVKKDRRKKLTQAKFVGGAENTAQTRANAAPELRQESEQVSLKDPPRFRRHPRPAASATALTCV